MNKVLFILFSTVLASCASMSPPTSLLIESVPVINVGESNDVPEEHIVFIPANTEFPVQFSIKGTIFNQNISSIVMTSLKKDLYLYKHWSSFDGKSWIKSHKLMRGEISAGIDKSGGKVEIILDLVQ